jgi:hypothetical protein
MERITIDTKGNSELEKEATELGLQETHRPLAVAEDEAGRGIWRLAPESPGMRIEFDPAIFAVSVEAGVVLIERR